MLNWTFVEHDPETQAIIVHWDEPEDGADPLGISKRIEEKDRTRDPETSGTQARRIRQLQRDNRSPRHSGA